MTAIDHRCVFSHVIFQNFIVISCRFKAFPRWRNLHHFESGVMKSSFNDGSKHDDISRVIIDTFGICIWLTQLLSFSYLWHIMSYLKRKIRLDILYSKSCESTSIWSCMLTSMSIPLIPWQQAAIQLRILSILSKFVALFSLMKVDILELTDSQVYITQTADREKPKAWNSVIKIHYFWHLCNDIENKGVLQGMSTKPNEKFHGPLRKIYLRQTNFKDTAKQVCICKMLHCGHD